MANMLYNGVELPDINAVWTDKTTYPYAYIRGLGGDEFSYELLFATQPFFETGGGAITSIGENGPGTGHLYYYDSAEKENGWINGEEFEGGSGMVEGFTDLWASHDILYYVDNSVYLAASDPVDPNASSHVTESSGNGFALYNGVKLPNIDTVWTEHLNADLKAEYPYVYIVYVTKPNLYLFSSNVVIKDGKVYTTTAGGYFHLVASSADSSSWTRNYNTVNGVPDPDKYPANYAIADTSNFSIGWTNDTVLNSDGSTYLAASDPIPLDGMTVIEWDGVTDGLDSYHYFLDFYKVSDDVISAENLIGSVFGFAGARAGEPIHIGYIFSAEDAMIGLPGGAYGMMNMSTGAAVGILPTAYEDSSPGVYLQQLPDGMVGTSVFAYTPAGSEPEEEPSTASSYLSSMLMGWIVGRRIAAQRGKVVTPDEPSDEPTGIYDDTVPLTWNSLVVTNNGAKFDYQGTPMVKISNLYGDAYDFNKYNKLNITTGGMTFTATLQGTQEIDGCIGGVYAVTIGTETMQLTAISVPAPGTYAGINIPEKGVYVTDYGALMPNESIDFESLDGVAKITWDGNTEGLEVSEDGFYYKVSDTVPSAYADDYTKLVYYTSNDGVDTTIERGNSSWAFIETESYFVLRIDNADFVFIILDEEVTYYNRTLTQGVWFCRIDIDSEFLYTKELHFDV